MTDGKHTPGPWIAIDYGDDPEVRTADNKRTICTLNCGHFKPSAEELANARLLAAAPELLGALRDLLAESYLMPPTCLGDAGLLINRRLDAEEAIAKATGGRDLASQQDRKEAE